MRAVVFEGPGRVRVGEVPEPRVEAPTDAVVRVTTASICGSDLHFLHGKAPLLPGDTMGHEAVGVVEEVGAEVRRFRPGDRAVVSFVIACGRCWFCRRGQSGLCEEFRSLGAGPFGGGLGGAQAELVRVPEADVNLLRVPEGLEDERALFVGDALTTGLYGAALAGVERGQTVAVVGAGPVGFFAAQAARLFEPEAVVVLDLRPDRLALAEKVGAVAVNVTERHPQTALAELTGGRGADAVVEAVGSPEAFETALDVVRRGGTVSVVGMYAVERVEVPLGVYWARAVRVLFAGVCPVHAWWERALEAVRAGRIDPLPLVSHALPLEEAPLGYRLFDAREATKVVLKP
ncbi:MAG TPA: alcohol dehydrogenase catalytic domain-containing protein [Actinomycetota bacterium]|nr:alcohol dehydrogenase catalytic domain-containing protein [Actinomycetota bacterium]